MSQQNQEIKSFGTGMTVMAWIIGLLMLTWFFSDYLDSQQNPNQHLIKNAHHSGVEPVVMLERNRAGHYLAPGKINDTLVNFLVDTGATDVAMSGDLARKLKLEIQGQGLGQTASGIVKTYWTRLDSVTLGSITLNNVKATIIENMPGDEVLLGMSFLKHLELTQKGDTLTLRL